MSLLKCVMVNIVGCDALLSSDDDDDVIKIASANGGGLDLTLRGTSGRDASPPPACNERLQLADWTARSTPSAPLLPSDVVVCLGTCRNGGYQTTTTTTTTTTGTPFPPPSYAESVCHCVQPASSVLRCHRHDLKSTAGELLTSHAAQLNYYTNRS